MKKTNESIQELLNYWKQSERKEGDESALSFRLMGLTMAQEIVLDKLEEEFPEPTKDTQNCLSLLRGAISDLQQIRRCLIQELSDHGSPGES
jgi:hypothetical protein